MEKITMNEILTIISLLISVLTMLITFLTVSRKINKKLDYLLRKMENEMTADQVMVICDIYIDYIQNTIRLKTEKYLSDELDQNPQNWNLDKIKNFISKLTQKTVSEARGKFGEFKIFGGETFNQFTGKLLEDRKAPTTKYQEKVFALVRNCAKGKLDLLTLQEKVKITINEGGEASKRRLKHAMRIQYRIN